MLEAIPKELIGLVGIALGAGIGFLGAKRSADTNLAIAREKLAADNRVANAASAAIEQLLRHPQWELRSFDAIKKHVRGFTDDELRQLLVASGAVSFDQLGTNSELWGLRERNSARLESVNADGQESFEIVPPDPHPSMG